MRLTVLIAVALGAGGCAGEVYTAGYGYSTYPYYYNDYYYGPSATVAVSPYVGYYPRHYRTRYAYPAYRTYRTHDGHPGHYYRGSYHRGGPHHHHHR
jgi:hypothetical protein